MIIPVIMAGGSGTRLWPLSRSHFPKQFLSINSRKTMLQETIARLARLPASDMITICNEKHRFLVAEQLREVGGLGEIILEPVGRDTAPAIALAALTAEIDSLLLVVAADHIVKDSAAFALAVNEALPLAASGKLVTFGVSPTEPLTAYGYIKAGGALAAGFEVDSFSEKPGLKDATRYLETGGYYWNSGMFLFRAGRYLEELNTYRPDIYQACVSAMEGGERDLDFFRVDPMAFAACPAESIDYAIMENTSEAVVVPLEAGWTDIGSWSSLWDVGSKDAAGNVTVGDVLLHETENSYVSSDARLVVTIGAKDLVVVSTKDVVLVANKSQAQEVKVIAQQIKSEARSEWDVHQTVYRPWGKYEVIEKGERFQVKRITVNPGASLSLQKHRYRSEHWVVVSSTARVTNGGTTFLLEENESTFIPSNVVHTLENPTQLPLEIIEIQSGSYLGEDDIVRLEDRYGRD